MSIFENMIFQVFSKSAIILGYLSETLWREAKIQHFLMCKPYVDIPELPWKGDPAPPQSTLPSKFGWPRIRGPWRGKVFFQCFWQTKEGPCGYEWTFCCMKVAEHMYRLMSNLGFVCQSSLTGRTVSKKNNWSPSHFRWSCVSFEGSKTSQIKNDTWSCKRCGADRAYLMNQVFVWTKEVL